MAQLTGIPGVTTPIQDLSIVSAVGESGVLCVLGLTKRGLEGEVYRITNYNDWLRNLGGLIEEDDFPEICKDALDNGAVLNVTPIHHFTDIADKSTIVGTKATAAIQNGPISEVLSKGSFEVLGGSVNAANKVTSIKVNSIEVLGADVPFTTDNDGTATAIAAQIVTYVSSPEYTGAAVTNRVDITAVAGTGSTPNGYLIEVTVEGDVVVGNYQKFAGGVDAEVNAILSLIAESVGEGYNGSTVEIAAPSNANTTEYVNLIVNLLDAPNAIVYPNIKRIQTAAELIATNSKLKGIQIDSITGQIPTTGTGTLSNGARDYNAITDADYSGSNVSKLGLHAFDGTTNSQRIINVNRANGVVDNAFKDYVEGRTDMRAMLRLPLGLSIDTLNDYLTGSGSFAHAEIDSFYVDYWYTDINVNDPDDPTIIKVISGIGKLMGRRSQIDRELGEWISIANPKNPLNGAIDVPINLIAPGNKGQADPLYDRGMNAIVDHKTFGVIPWGNGDMLKDKSELTSQLNIADLVVFIARQTGSIANAYNFVPNDIQMFRDLYRAVRPFITGTLTSGRAIEGNGLPMDGEGVWWHWLGDQDAADLNQLVINTTDEVDQGKYRVRFAFKPIAANKFIEITVSPADSQTIQNVQILNSL